jgi:hypothetical protein
VINQFFIPEIRNDPDQTIQFGSGDIGSDLGIRVKSNEKKEKVNDDSLTHI